MFFSYSAMQIEIVNGPSLGDLGKREPSIYGNRSWTEYFDELRYEFEGIELDWFQSNHEGAIIDYLFDARDRGVDAIVINAGAYTHTSIAIMDAIKAINLPVVEVHISNVMKREEFRHHSYISPVSLGTISGFGLDSYRLAISALQRHLETNSCSVY